MIKLSELRDILHQNKLRGYSHYTKKDLIELLREKGLLAREVEPLAREVEPSVRERLKTIRKNPKEVVLRCIETDEELAFPSIYKASQFIKQSPRIITFWDGRVWRNKYKITVK